MIHCKESQEYQILQSLGIELPQPAIDKLFDSSADTAGEMIEQSGIYYGIASQIASMAMDGIAYVITFILVGIVCTILSQALKNNRKDPYHKWHKQMVRNRKRNLKGLCNSVDIYGDSCYELYKRIWKKYDFLHI